MVGLDDSGWYMDREDADTVSTLMGTCLPSSPEGQVVDLGCGKGALLARLQEEHPKSRYLGIDRDHRIVEVARRLHETVDFREGDLMETGLPDMSVDLLLSVNIGDYAYLFGRPLTFEGLADEANRILKPGGLYFVWDDFLRYKLPENGLEATVVERNNIFAVFRASGAEPFLQSPRSRSLSPY